MGLEKSWHCLEEWIIWGRSHWEQASELRN